MDEQQADRRIIDLYFTRNEQAIAETDRRYGGFCMRISLGILEDRLDAEECLNDTYIQAWNNIPPTRPNSLRAFLAKIVRNLSLKRLEYNNAAKRNRTFDLSLEELAGAGLLWGIALHGPASAGTLVALRTVKTAL